MASILKVDTIKHKDGTAALEIDSNGRIDLKSPVGFCVSKDGNLNITAQNTRISGWTQGIQGSFNTDGAGGTMMDETTGVLTIPVDGYYQFDISLRLDSFAGTYVNFDLVYPDSSNAFQSGIDNRVARILSGGLASNYEDFHLNGTRYLVAGKKIALFYQNSGDNNVTIDGDSYFSMFKVG